MRPELLTTTHSIKRRFDVKEKDGCLIVKAKLQDIGSPLVYQLETDDKKYYLSKLHFTAQKTKDGVKLCYFDAKKLPKNSPRLEKLRKEMLAYLAHRSFNEMYESLGLPRQLVYKHIAKLSLKRKELVNKEVKIDFEEILEAYKQNKIEELAVNYDTTPYHVYKLLLKGLMKLKRKLKNSYYDKTLYIFRVIGEDGKDYCYYYKPYYDKERKKSGIKYYARCSDVSEEDIATIEEEKKALLKEIEDIDKTIEEVKLVMKNSN